MPNVKGLLLIAMALFAASGAKADDPPLVVVELFTSQGCNSCPPADLLVGELAKRGDVLPLSYNVDYWDYLGWKDTLGRPEWTERQRAYARTLRSRSVYTPQLVVAGVTHVVGSDRRAAEARIADSQRQPPVAELRTLASPSGELAIEVLGADAPKPASLWLVRYEEARKVEIGRGENRGRTITYHNVARELHRIGEWRGGAAKYAIAAQFVQGEGRRAVFLQEDGNGAILAASRLP